GGRARARGVRRRRGASAGGCRQPGRPAGKCEEPAEFSRYSAGAHGCALSRDRAVRSNAYRSSRQMKIGIAFKLFCALLGAGIVMATAMGVASRISFQRGFLGYLNDLETQRLAVLTATLAAVYEDHGDWTFLRGEEGEWRRIGRASDRSFRQARDAGQSGAAPAANDAANASVPRGADPAAAAPAGAPAAPGAAASGSTSGGTGGVTRTSRTTLLDAGRQVIAGDPTPSPDARY